MAEFITFLSNLFKPEETDNNNTKFSNDDFRDIEANGNLLVKENENDLDEKKDEELEKENTSLRKRNINEVYISEDDGEFDDNQSTDETTSNSYSDSDSDSGSGSDSDSYYYDSDHMNRMQPNILQEKNPNTSRRIKYESDEVRQLLKFNHMFYPFVENEFLRDFDIDVFRKETRTITILKDKLVYIPLINKNQKKAYDYIYFNNISDLSKEIYNGVNTFISYTLIRKKEFDKLLDKLKSLKDVYELEKAVTDFKNETKNEEEKNDTVINIPLNTDQTLGNFIEEKKQENSDIEVNSNADLSNKEVVNEGVKVEDLEIDLKDPSDDDSSKV